MASKETWAVVAPFFKPNNTSDKWGDPDAIDDGLILRLFDFRNSIGIPIYVTRGVQTSGHAKRSYHYPRDVEGRGKVGFAVDVVIPNWDRNTFDLILEAEKFNFTGLGYYPHWRFKGIPVGGFHLDTRPIGKKADGTFSFRESRWLGYPTPDGKQKYTGLTYENIMRYAKFPEYEDHQSH